MQYLSEERSFRSGVALPRESFSRGHKEGLRPILGLLDSMYTDKAFQTASVDVATDALIQKTIRTEFGDKTLLTIGKLLRHNEFDHPLMLKLSSVAHRLRTIISYDRVLVMDKGHIAEFASPLELFENTEGIFRGMCDSSSITREDIERSRFETLHEIAEAQAVTVT